MKQKEVALRDYDKSFVILTISRNEVREICGKAAAAQMGDKDMRRLADEMAEYCFDDNFVEALRQTIEDKFSESSEAEGE